MSDYSETDNYEVGYGKPPKSGQFKKGASGNPSGRPKKPKDFQAKVTKELDSTMVIIENGKRKLITKAEAMAKQAVNKAVSGNIQYIRLALDCSRQTLEKAAEEQRLADRSLIELTDGELWFRIIADIKKSTSAAQMAEALAQVAQMLNLAKPELLGLPVICPQRGFLVDE
jgi:hypothetical protein